MPTETPGHTESGTAQSVAAVIVAAGDSRRMDGVDKVLAPIMGRPLVAYSLQAFDDSPLIGTIVLVMSERNIEEGRRLVEEGGWHKVREVCAGGRRRQDSVRNGLNRVRDTDWTAVHDGARPCVDGDMIARGLEAARQDGSAVAGVPVRDTIKAAGPDLLVDQTFVRDGLWAVQTPQVFRTDLLLQAHRDISEDVTDDASMVERAGRPVRIFMGSHENIKVTTPEDMALAGAILKARQ